VEKSGAAGGLFAAHNVNNYVAKYSSFSAFK
jgi:hypothetical protein